MTECVQDASLDPALPPTERELDMALTWTLLNICRGFHRVQADDVTAIEQRFLVAWRQIPAERRQAALDFVIPITPASASTDCGKALIKRAKL